jgi:sugar lactone lactonase YvrE
VLVTLALSACGGAARHAGPAGHIEAGAGFAQGGPEQLAFDGAGNLYGVDCQDSWVFRIDPNGLLWIVGGTGAQDFSGNGRPAVQAAFTCPSGVAVDSSGNVYVADHDNRIRRIDPRGVVHAFAGAGPIPVLFSGDGSFGGDGGPARLARFRVPGSLAIDAHDNMFLSDGGNGAVREIDPTHTVATVAKTGRPQGIAVDAAGVLYVADAGSNRVWRVGRHGPITTFARLRDPGALAFDAHGNLYVAEPDANIVRRIDPSGSISTAAGTGRAGFTGDGGPATKADLNRPDALAFDSKGNLYIGDHDNGAVRRVDRQGKITTFCDGRV